MNRLLLLCRVVLSVAVTLGCVLAPLGILSAPSLSNGQVLGFRDGVHYYPPLLRYERLAWRHGIPLWNSAEERGRPLLADPTASVLYPPQWLLMRAESISSAHLRYVWGHVGLAAGTMYLAARRLRVRPPSAALAAVSYAYGGAVLFQTCNLPYLVGAAWLPLGLAGCLEVAQYRNRRGIALLAATLVLMVLGGDAETAYLLGLAAVLAAVVAHTPLLRSWRNKGVWNSLAASILCVSAAIGLGIGLSAIQWMPTAEWTSLSDRLAANNETLERQRLASDFDPSDDQTIHVTQRRHDQVRLDFSIGPWRWIELFWCNAGGKPFPEHSRWMTAIPAEGRFWTASLYQGLMPALLGLSAWRVRRGRFTERWLSWIVLIAVLGSLGRFGFGWVWSELNYAVSGDPGGVAPELGGLYDLMVRCLPGFALFRYPAKLWIWAAAGLCLLAARRWDDAIHQERPALTRRVLSVYLIASVALLMFSWSAWSIVRPWLAAAPADSLFGPLQVPIVKQQVARSLFQGVLVGGLAFGFARRVRLQPSVLSWLPAVLTAIELSLSHAWLVPTIADASPLPLAADSAVQASDGSIASDLVYRAAPRIWYPKSWSMSSSRDRLQQSVAWDRATFRPKYPLGRGYRLLTSSTSFSTRTQRALTKLLESTQARSPDQASELLYQLGVHTIVSPARQDWPGWQRQPNQNEVAWQTEFNCWKHPAPRPRVWIVPKAIPISTATAETGDELAKLQDTLLPQGQVRDLSREVVLPIDDPPFHASITDLSNPEGPELDASTNARHSFGEALITRDDGRVLEVQTVQPAAGWLVLNDAWLPGWTGVATDESGQSRAVEILPANGIMRAVALPAGRHTVRFEYAPAAWNYGRWTSALSLVAASIACVAPWHRWRRRVPVARGPTASF